MVDGRSRCLPLLLLALLWFPGASLRAQDAAGSIRGLVLDRDFNAPLGDAQVLIVETARKTTTGDQGTWVFPDVAPGRYTLVFSKEGYVRAVRADVVVSAGQLTDVNVELAGDFVEMDEFRVQDILAMAGGSEAALLQLRLDSPAFMDSIGADLMSRAGAGDAASALRLISGATVQDGKFAVVRGLPDRYVNSQMNGVRLPTADEDKRAVQLDQFPSAVIESIQVSKTFTPDQQGDASGGAVNVVLKGVPDEPVFEFSSQVSVNSQASGQSDFIGSGKGPSTFGGDGGDPQLDKLNQSWSGAVGVSPEDAPLDYKLSGAVGDRAEFGDGLVVGGSFSAFYERDSSFFENGIDDSYWVENAGDPLTPEKKQQSGTEFLTSLYDVTQSTQSVRWGGLGTLGLETETDKLGLSYLYTSSTEDKTTLAEDTRGKAHFFPGYDVNDPMDPGNQQPDVAPYLRTETLETTDRTTQLLQLHGEHELPWSGFSLGGLVEFDAPELDWSIATSSATASQPDKRLFGSQWAAPQFKPGIPFLGIPDSVTDPTWSGLKPSANVNLGNLQRVFKDIEETSDQGALNLKLPFQTPAGRDGYVKFGWFDDSVKRTYDQDSYSNAGDTSTFVGDFSEFWSGVFPDENHPIVESTFDVDYRGTQDITAWYYMLDLPISSQVNLVGGTRFEHTEIGITNIGEKDSFYYSPKFPAQIALDAPGVADASIKQDDVLPSIGLVYAPLEELTLRTSFAKTIARMTFKELSPVIQQEYAGGPIFIGNPDLQMSDVTNWDLRADYRPYEGGLASASWFRKDITDAIENVQAGVDFTYTTPVNYPSGELTGYELELRHDLGHFRESWEGLGVGANATFIDSVVQLPADEVAAFAAPGIEVPLTERDMTNAPEHLYNFYVTYDIEHTGTRFALFYTLRGDTLVEGAGISKGNFVPSVYELGYGSLNFSVSQEVGESSRLTFQAKNLTDPDIDTVYRSDVIGADVTKTSYTRGREFSIGLSGRF